MRPEAPPLWWDPKPGRAPRTPRTANPRQVPSGPSGSLNALVTHMLFSPCGESNRHIKAGNVSLSEWSYKTNNSEMVMLSEIKKILDDKLIPQSDKVTCFRNFFVVKIRRHKPDKARASAALMRLWYVLAHLYKWLSWKYSVSKCRKLNFSYLPLATAAPLIPKFNLKVKYNLQLFRREAFVIFVMPLIYHSFKNSNDFFKKV